MAALLQLQSCAFIPPIQVDDGPRIWFNLELALGEVRKQGWLAHIRYDTIRYDTIDRLCR